VRRLMERKEVDPRVVYTIVTSFIRINFIILQRRSIMTKILI